MANPTRHIVNGPGHRDLELAFITRHLGAAARFTIFGEGLYPTEVEFSILNFSFVTCHGKKYNLGGRLKDETFTLRKNLPPFKFIFVEYFAEERNGTMEFSNGE